MLTLADRLSPAEHTASETTEGQTVIINLQTGTLFSLNKTGSFVWQRLDGQKTLGELAADLATHYGVETTVTEPDVLELATALWRENLVRKTP
ncbi:MAG: PqqD family protein [Caldilineales bacterium]|nr:PqqD family protein [Caldilineales bacterium]